MARREEWHDDYWLLLIQLYLKKPQGVKHLYSRSLIDVAMELHIHPAEIHQRLFRLRQINTPRLQRLWDTYANSPKKLKRGINLLRQMKGFGNASVFYDGVEINESWEKDFKPIGTGTLTPVKLILILDLYFRLTPITMVEDTPEVQELSKLIRETPKTIVDVMDVFLVCDPYISEYNYTDSPFFPACNNIWKRFGNEDLEALAALAAQLKEYFVNSR